MSHWTYNNYARAGSVERWEQLSPEMEPMHTGNRKVRVTALKSP